MSDEDHSDLARLAELEAEAERGGGDKLQRRQHRLGRLLARERIDALLDAESFTEIGKLTQVSKGGDGEAGALGDGVICGFGRIDGRRVAVYAHDATVLRGALSVGGARKIVRLMDVARRQRLPIVAIHDSDGVRVDEGPEALAGFAEILGRTANLSGWVPQIGVVLGLCVGGAAYSSALMDVIIGHDETGFLFVTGSKVTKIVTGQDAPIEEIGGVSMHATTTGLVQLRAGDERACIEHARKVLAYLPSCAADAPPVSEATDPVDRATPEVSQIVPTDERKGYDVKKLVHAVVDEGTFVELSPEYARSLVVGLCRFGGRAVGVVASQPSHNAGCLDVDSSRKGARFIQLCSAFGLPIVTFCDVPGFLPGKRQEQGGLLLHGAKLIAAYAACRSPLVSLIVRKSYGGGNVLAYPADLRLAFPFARVQPMGTAAAQAVASHRTFGGGEGADAADQVEARFGEGFDAMERAAQAGFVDRIIRPEDTRRELAGALALLAERPDRDLPPRHHPNVPL
jgi:acetyl-CoA carboxylase carboxyltransferase component